MRYAFLNNFTQELAASLGESDTSMTLDDNGDLLANASADLVYTLTLDDGEGTVEIVHVTGASGNVLTVERGKEGTTDRTWPSGTAVEMRVTAGVMGALAWMTGEKEFVWTSSGNGTIDAPGLDDWGGDTMVMGQGASLVTDPGYWGGATVFGSYAEGGEASVTSFGAYARATGEYAVAVGAHARATGEYAVAVGGEARAEDDRVIAIGEGPRARGDGAVCISPDSRSNAPKGVTIGAGAQSSGNINIPTQAPVTIGSNAKVFADYGVALGAYAKTEGGSAVSIGPYCESSGDKSVALGMSSTAGGSQAVAIGHIAKAEAEGAIALGAASRAEEAGAISIGGSALAQGAMAVGSAGFAQAPGSQAFGLSTVTTVPWSRLNHTLPVAAKTPGAVPNELEGDLPPGMTMLDILAANGLSIPLAATHNTTQVAIASDPVDLSDGAAAVSVDFPAGVLMLIDAIDVVIVEADGAGGGPEISIGPDDLDPVAYLAATPVTKTVVGGRETHAPLVSDGVTSLRVAVDTAGTGTYKAKIVFRGYVMEV